MVLLYCKAAYPAILSAVYLPGEIAFCSTSSIYFPDWQVSRRCRIEVDDILLPFIWQKNRLIATILQYFKYLFASRNYNVILWFWMKKVKFSLAYFIISKTIITGIADKLSWIAEKSLLSPPFSCVAWSGWTSTSARIPRRPLPSKHQKKSGKTLRRNMTSAAAEIS